MSQVVIENPVINSPFEEPARHFRFDEQSITNTIVPERRISQYFIAHVDDGHGPDDPLKLIIEVTGAKNKDKEAKVAAAQTLWVPAVNNAGTWGR